MNNYSDLSNAFGDNIEAAIRHYIVSGYAEGRTDINKSFANTKIQFEYLNSLSINNDFMNNINPNFMF